MSLFMSSTIEITAKSWNPYPAVSINYLSQQIIYIVSNICRTGVGIKHVAQTLKTHLQHAMLEKRRMT
jgi:hypothetical protein